MKTNKPFKRPINSNAYNEYCARHKAIKNVFIVSWDVYSKNISRN